MPLERWHGFHGISDVDRPGAKLSSAAGAHAYILAVKTLITSNCAWQTGFRSLSSPSFLFGPQPPKRGHLSGASELRSPFRHHSGQILCLVRRLSPKRALGRHLRVELSEAITPHLVPHSIQYAKAPSLTESTKMSRDNEQLLGGRDGLQLERQKLGNKRRCAGSLDR